MTSPATSSQSLQTLFDRLVVFASASETVVFNTPLQDCYPGVDGNGPVAVELNVTGTYTVPVGATVAHEVRKQNPATGDFVVITSTIEIRGTESFVVIQPADHGITSESECGIFLIQFIATYPGARVRVKFFGGQSFQICPDCTEGDSDQLAAKATSSKKAKPRKKS